MFLWNKMLETSEKIWKPKEMGQSPKSKIEILELKLQYMELKHSVDEFKSRMQSSE